ncbi:ankyrin-1-like isoform X1 [Trichogramma pretiosum]|uniref:ankyrin-1-like isoform X1 n=2 Tax=Trichogramma pretiosum TaxID=7493 RepID=UPI000C71A4AB|nr:ankyrin-1-like isoform X1 [Trichogramma pretiosum]
MGTMGYYNVEPNLGELLPGLPENFESLDLNAIDDKDIDAFFYTACVIGRKDVVEKILKFGQNPDLVVQKSINPPLHLAVIHNRREVAEILLKYGADPQVKNINGLLPLQVICKDAREDCYEWAKMLFVLGNAKYQPLRVHDRTMMGNTPLHHALIHKKQKLAELLLENGANPNYTNRDEDTSLHIVCKISSDPYDLAKMLFERSDKKYQPLDINAQNEFGQTPLHLALANGHMRLSELMLRNGSDPNSANRWGSTPLHTICMTKNDDEELARMLFELSDGKYHPVKIDTRNHKGQTPLHLALLNENQRITELLLRAGADPNIVNEDRTHPLHIICKTFWYVDMIELFFKISKEANQSRVVEVDARDMFGNTPLHLALRNWVSRDAASLLKRGANPNLTNTEGSTPLHMICENPKIQTSFVKTFFEINDANNQTVQVDAKDNRGNTPLHLAIRGDNKMCTELLLRAGADPNLADAEGLTPLLIICDKQYDAGLARILFDVSDDRDQTVQIDVADKNGLTPLQLAVQNLLPYVVDAILDHGADLSNYVFPTNYFIERFNPEKNKSCKLKLELACGLVAVIDHFENRGYEFYRSEALAIMKCFADYGLFEKSSDLQKWYDDEQFASWAKDTKIFPKMEESLRNNRLDREAEKNQTKTTPSLSVYDLFPLAPKEAKKLLAYRDGSECARTWDFAGTNRPTRQDFLDACVANVCEKLSRRFFQRWALDCYWELTHYRLPIECCEMIIDDTFTNENLYNICLATELQIPKDDKKEEEITILNVIKLVKQCKMAEE